MTEDTDPFFGLRLDPKKGLFFRDTAVPIANKKRPGRLSDYDGCNDNPHQKKYNKIIRRYAEVFMINTYDFLNA